MSAEPNSARVEIILPVRNPTGVLGQTAASLAAQSDRAFSVLLSDNHSTTGGEFMEAAAVELERAGIVVRRVRPPVELGRVEHWNWAHYEARAAWLKPVFAGDWLAVEYVARLRAVIAAHAECRYVFASYVYHRGGQAPVTIKSAWAGRFHTAVEMERVVLRYAMQFGPPSAAAIERTAFAAIGGYPVSLPICADSLMFCALASRFGAFGLAEPLCHFNIHDARFSTSLPQRRKDTLFETLTYCFVLAYRAWSERAGFSRPGFARLLARELRVYWSNK